VSEDDNLQLDLETVAAKIRARLAAGGPPQPGAALAFILAAMRKLEEGEKR
jgi:hypothetical protein